MDNQQVTLFIDLDEIERANLGGLIDGEGSLGINRMNTSRNRLSIYFAIGNTDKGIVDRIVYLFDKMKIKYYITYKETNGFSKNFWEIRVGQQKSISHIIENSYDYLYGNKKQISLLVDLFIYQRQVRFSGGGRGSKFDDFDMQFYHALKKLNKRGSSETTRDTSINLSILDMDEDIVQLLEKSNG